MLDIYNHPVARPLWLRGLIFLRDLACLLTFLVGIGAVFSVVILSMEVSK